MTDHRALEFGLLGPLSMSMAAASLPLGTPKQRAVLAMLLINRNRVVSTEALIDAVWDQSPVPGARTTLHSYVFNLRRLCTNAGVNPHVVLATAPPGYRLRVDDGACDLDRFTSAKLAGFDAAAESRFDEASAHLSAALAQWRGAALADVRDFGFADAFATALAEDAVLVHTARCEAEIACGRGYGVIGQLESLVAEHPYREPLWAQLMAAYYVADRQSDALEAYRRLKSVLAEELGIDPGPALSELHGRILRQERLNTAATARTTAVRSAADAHTATATAAHAALRDASGRLHILGSAVTRIGRHPDNDVVLKDIEVSRHHAVVIATGGSFVVTDLKSANGIHVGGRRIQPSASLTDGDRVRIGGQVLTFETSL